MLIDPININLSDFVTSLVTVLVTAGSVLFALRRRASRDNTEIVKDRAEESIITHLERQRDKAVEERERVEQKCTLAEREKNEALFRVNKLTAEVEHLSSQIKLLKELVDRLSISLESTKSELRECITDRTNLILKLGDSENDN